MFSIDADFGESAIRSAPEFFPSPTAAKEKHFSKAHCFFLHWILQSS